jgi:excisionase family DNA binding protein
MVETEAADWLTKEQAAAAIGVSTKTIEAWAKAGKLHQRRARSPKGTGVKVAVYHPAEVEALRAERQPDATPYLVPAGSGALPAPAPRGGVPPVDRRALATAIEFLLGVAVDGGGAAPRPGVRPVAELALVGFLAPREAAALANLPYAEIRRLMKAGTLPARKVGGAWRIRRADVEALWTTSTSTSAGTSDASPIRTPSAPRSRARRSTASRPKA